MPIGCPSTCILLWISILSKVPVIEVVRSTSGKKTKHERFLHDPLAKSKLVRTNRAKEIFKIKNMRRYLSTWRKSCPIFSLKIGAGWTTSYTECSVGHTPRKCPVLVVFSRCCRDILRIQYVFSVSHYNKCNTLVRICIWLSLCVWRF